MCALFSDDEVGKSVENDAGEEVGIVASVEGDVAHVKPNTGAVDSIKSSIGWDGVVDETHPVTGDSVREITDDAVRLEAELPTEDESDGSETDLTAQSDDEAEPETEPAGGSTGVEETQITDDLREETGEDHLAETDSIDADELESTDDARTDATDETGTDRGLEADPTELARQNPEAEFNPGDTSSRTDAAVDPSDGSHRDDAQVDPDVVDDAKSSHGGPTTEDASREVPEDGSEEE